MMKTDVLLQCVHMCVTVSAHVCYNACKSVLHITTEL